MKEILAILHIPNEPEQYFRFNLPDPGEKDFYRHVTSYSCFRNRELGRAFPWDEKTQTCKYKQNEVKYCSLYRIHDACDMRGIQWSLDHKNILLEDIKHVGSLYDFYDIINYDRKKKKYK